MLTFTSATDKDKPPDVTLKASCKMEPLECEEIALMMSE